MGEHGGREREREREIDREVVGGRGQDGNKNRPKGMSQIEEVGGRDGGEDRVGEVKEGKGRGPRVGRRAERSSWRKSRRRCKQLMVRRGRP